MDFFIFWVITSLISEQSGNGITIQSNTGIEGSYLFITNGIIVKDNVISGSKGAGVSMLSTKLCSVTGNSITGQGYCVTATNTTSSVITGNKCTGGLGLKSSLNKGLVSDLDDVIRNGAQSNEIFNSFALLGSFILQIIF
jgi:nitrous oxidase accessory protein NosD